MSNSSTRGHALKLSKHFSRVKCRAFNFPNRFIDVWNSLENTLSLRRRSILLNVVLRVLILISLFVLHNVQGWCKLSVYF